MSDKQWYIQVGEGKKAGPVSFERLKQLAEQKKISPKTNVRLSEPGSAWTPAGAVEDLFSGSLPSIFSDEFAAESLAEHVSDDSVERTPVPKDEAAVEIPAEASGEKTGSNVVSAVKIVVGQSSEKPEKKPRDASSIVKINVGGRSKKSKPDDSPPKDTSSAVKIALGGTSENESPASVEKPVEGPKKEKPGFVTSPSRPEAAASTSYKSLRYLGDRLKILAIIYITLAFLGLLFVVVTTAMLDVVSAAITFLFGGVCIGVGAVVLMIVIAAIKDFSMLLLSLEEQVRRQTTLLEKKKETDPGE